MSLRREYLLWHLNTSIPIKRKSVCSYGFRELCRIYGMSQGALKARIRLYNAFGWEGLVTGSKARQYSSETKHEEHSYPIQILCKLGGVSHTAYYKWIHRKVPESELENQRIADEIEKIHKDSPDKGYRRIRNDLECYHGTKDNDK